MSSQQRRGSRSERPRVEETIRLRIGSPRTPANHEELLVNGPQDARLIAQTIDNHLRAYPRQLLILTIDSHRPWLRDILSAILLTPLDHIIDLNREVQYSTTSRLPEKPVRGCWSFIVDQINVPEVFYWSLRIAAPRPTDSKPLDLNKAKMRVGAWIGGPGCLRFSSSVPLALIFTKSDRLSDSISSELLFGALYKDGEPETLNEDSALCLIFSRLFWLLTDWQNIIRELNARLAVAEVNSHHRDYPVKYRTRAMHREVARIHELKDYLRFHLRSFNKLQRTASQKDRSDLDDIVDDLSHFEESLDSLKERLNNLLGLEFNIQAADQSEGSAFLSVVATLFLPLSYLTSLWGISTSTWTTIWYITAAVIVFSGSAAFLILYPWLSRKWVKKRYHLDKTRVMLRPQDFTMLGQDLPDSVDGPHQAGRGGARHQSQQLGGVQLQPERRRSSQHPSQGREV